MSGISVLGITFYNHKVVIGSMDKLQLEATHATALSVVVQKLIFVDKLAVVGI